MSRKGDFSLMYEIVGLLIFAVVSLVWFTGVESIVGGLTTNKAVDAFNQLTGAIKSQCLGGGPVTLTGLDLNTYGSTYIITQLRIPPNMDPNTMGTIQPQMRKCVDADCLCLLKLNELDGNWQMCTTSDWDSWNLAIGGILGAPGCPFWYYAPPEILAQSIQSVMDYLSIDAYQFILSATPWFRDEDPTEHFSYPAPELWGGCSYANENNLTITSFSKFHPVLDCDSLAGKKLRDFLGDPQLSGFVDIDFNANPSLLTDKLSDIDKATDMLISNYFLKSVDADNGKTYEGIIKNFLRESVHSSEFDEEMRSSIDSILTLVGVNEESIDKCKDEVMNAIKDSYGKVYGNHDIISKGEKGSVEIYGDYKVNASFTPDFDKLNIRGFNISFVAKNTTVTVPLLYVKMGDCEQSLDIATSDYKRYVLHFAPSCLDNIIYFKEAFGTEERKIKIKTANDGLASQYYQDGEWVSSDDLLINITFDKKYGNSIKSYVESLIAIDLMNQSFEGAQVDGNPLNSNGKPAVDKYVDLISNAVSGFSFNDYNSVLHQNYMNNYNSYFNTILEKVVFEKDSTECIQVYDSVSDIKNSYLSIEDSTISNLNNYFLGKINNLPDLKVDFSANIHQKNYEFKQINSSIESFSIDMAQQQSPFIRDALDKCLGYQIDDNYSDMIESNYSFYLNLSLANSSSSLIDELNSVNLNLGNLPKDFSFKETFKDYFLGLFTNATLDLFGNLDSEIRTSVLKAASYVSDELGASVQKAWKGRPLYPVDCWPKVGGGYFKGYPAVNDLLAWRKYTSVSRLTPFLAMFTLDAANRVVVQPITNHIQGALFKKIDNTIDIHTYTDVGLTKEDVFNKNLNVEYGVEAGSGIMKMSREEAYKLFENGGKPFKIIGREHIPLSSIPFTGSFIFPNSITGASFISRVLNHVVEGVIVKEGTKVVVSKSFKKFLKRSLVKLAVHAAGVAVQVGINLWKYSIFTSVNEDEVVYANGGIRTFNPNLVEVKSCVRMDELGCPSTYSVWVNESYYCNTDLYVRRIVNPATWFNYIEGNDKCQFATHGEEGCISEWNSSKASCYKDTLTTCYKLSCSTTGDTDLSNGDRYHVFQYWIGANSDPAHLLGMQAGKIRTLKVYNASLGNRNVIMLEVMGGNETSALPASIV